VGRVGSLPAGRHSWLVTVLISNELYRNVFAVRSFVSVPALDLQGLVVRSNVLKDALFITGYAVTCLESEIQTDCITFLNINLVIWARNGAIG
jgi:hypothetical protein